MASIYLGLNRNKRSIVLDLKSEPARQALLALIDRADVLLHNNRPQKMKALGWIRDRPQAQSAIVYVCLTALASWPLWRRPAYDDIVQGLCGSPISPASGWGSRITCPLPPPTRPRGWSV